MSEDRPRRLIVAPAAEIVGRQVRQILDNGGAVAGFVGDLENDEDALDQFVGDVARDG